MNCNKLMAMAWLLAALACEKRHIDDNIPPAVVNLTKGSLQTVDFDDSIDRLTDTPFATNAGFRVVGNTTVTLAIDEGVLADHNAKQGTAYRPLPSDCYTLENASGVIKSGARSVSFRITFDCDALRKLDSPDMHVLPLTLRTTGESAVGNQSGVLLQPRNTGRP